MNELIKRAMNDVVLKKAEVFFDVKVDDFIDLKGFENFVYGVGDVIIRFVHSDHRRLSDVLAEIEFIDYLASNNASVPTVFKSKNGRLVEEIDLNDGYYFYVTCYSKAIGSMVTKEDMNSELFYTLGKDIGRLHALAKDYKPVHRRIEWFEEDYIGKTIPYMTSEDEVVLQKAYEIFNKVKGFEMNEQNYGLIHTDLHFSNMFYSDKKLTFFDFDDSSYKYFISDIAIVLFYYFVFSDRSSDRLLKTKEIMIPFMKGYHTENSLPMSEFYKLNDFLKLRETILYLVVKADSYGEENNPRTHHFLSYLRNNIVNDVLFYEDLDWILELF